MQQDYARNGAAVEPANGRHRPACADTVMPEQDAVAKAVKSTASIVGPGEWNFHHCLASMEIPLRERKTRIRRI